MRELARKSLTSATLVRVAYRVGLVILAMTGLAYYHVVSALESRSLESLEEYVEQRGRREQALFEIAEARQEAVRGQAVERLRAVAGTDPGEAFDTRFARFPDGTTRTRLEGFDGTRDSFGFMGKNATIDADLRRRVMVFLELSEQFGPAWRGVFQNFYITAPDNLLVGYWPEVPDWAHRADADLDIAAEEYSWAADPEHDPGRETVWTGLFYDQVAGVWMVSAETPIDVDGRWVGTIGLDLPLQELIDRTLEKHLVGAHNFIVRGDGRLIAHPERMDRLREGEGRYDVAGDAELERAVTLVRDIQGTGVVLDERGRAYLAATRLGGPEWIFVTVYPRALISDAAAVTARGVLVLGLLSLLLELAIFYWILRRFVGVPLRGLVRATDRVSEGDLSVRLDEGRPDELGRLARSFNTMAASVARRTEDLKNEVRDRETAQRATEVALREREVLLQEIHHRVKNNLQVISSLLSMQASRAGTSGSPDHAGLVSSRERVLAMARLHEKLYAGDSLARVPFLEYLRETAEHLLAVSQRSGEIEVEVAGDEMEMSLDQALPCALLVNELVSNAIQHAFPPDASGRVEVLLRTEPEHVSVTVRDTAGTLPPDWESRDDSLGLLLVRSLARQIGGTLTSDVRPGSTEFVVRFPREA